MTTAEETATELANKKGIARFIGGLTGSNKALQDKINSNRAISQYAAQQMLNKLVEQNLTTLDIVTVLNNKLNASIVTNDEQINHIYKWLLAFFKQNRSDIFKMETRTDKLERNVQLLNWENSIDYQQFDGVDYAELDDESKIVCLVRDFYDITHGQWTAGDLLLLKSAMSIINIAPRDKINYFRTVKKISTNQKLKEKLLGTNSLPEIDEPSYLISSATFKKLDNLREKEHYIVETVIKTLSKHNIIANSNDIVDSLTLDYLAQEAQVNANIEVETFDFLIDLLFNLQQLNTAQLHAVEKSMPIDKQDKPLTIKQNIELFNQTLKSAHQGEATAQCKVAKYYATGFGTNANLSEAAIWYKKAAEQNNAEAQLCLGRCYESGIGIEAYVGTAVFWYKKAAYQGNAEAQFCLGRCYDNGIGVSKDEALAFEWYKKAARNGSDDAKKHLQR